ncbi:peptidase inhibitor family I36 protein [Streptomyces sp. NPDC005480]|uniref:peptidase inhibitor family I36 protein n=1 Tax=Streptomyces sp. NPDC005480 TaxID=3154880 RepID=UPI0033A6CA03
MKRSSGAVGRRGLRAGLIVFVLAGSGIGVTSVEASAATACPQGSVCFYKDANFQGGISIQQRLVESPYQIANFVNSHFQDGTTLENQVSSVINNSDRTLCLWSNRNFQGQYNWGVTSHFYAAQIPNDVMTSARTVPAGQSC